MPAESEEELLAELPAEVLPLDALSLDVAEALLDELPAEGGDGAGGGGVGPAVVEELTDAELLISPALLDETAELAEESVVGGEFGAGLLIATARAGLSASLAPHETSNATTAGAATNRTHGVGARIVVLPRRHLHSHWARSMERAVRALARPAIRRASAEAEAIPRRPIAAAG